MNNKTVYFRVFFIAFLMIFTFTLSAQFSFAGCDESYFKTNYHKVNAIDKTYFDNKDWNNDGSPDFWKIELDSNTNSYNIKVFFHNGNGDWDFDNPTILKTDSTEVFEPYFFEPILIDFDSDGDLDFIPKRTLQFPVTERVYRNNGDNTFTGLSPMAFPGEALISVLGYFDVNGDGYLDRVTETNVPNQGHSIGYNPANPDGTFGARVDVYTGTDVLGTPGIKLIGDFTGDGKVDIAPQFFEQGSVVTESF